MPVRNSESIEWSPLSCGLAFSKLVTLNSTYLDGDDEDEDSAIALKVLPLEVESLILGPGRPKSAFVCCCISPSACRTLFWLRCDPSCEEWHLEVVLDSEGWPTIEYFGGVAVCEASCRGNEDNG